MVVDNAHMVLTRGKKGGVGGVPSSDWAKLAIEILSVPLVLFYASPVHSREWKPSCLGDRGFDANPDQNAAGCNWYDPTLCRPRDWHPLSLGCLHSYIPITTTTHRTGTRRSCSEPCLWHC